MRQAMIQGSAYIRQRDAAGADCLFDHNPGTIAARTEPQWPLGAEGIAARSTPVFSSLGSLSFVSTRGTLQVVLKGKLSNGLTKAEITFEVQYKTAEAPYYFVLEEPKDI